MSTLFGNPPSGNGDGNSGANRDRKPLFPSRLPLASGQPGERGGTAATSGTQNKYGSSPSGAEQSSLFPRREPTPASGSQSTPPRAPLFPPRENREPLFPRRGGEAGEPASPRAPLFPARDAKTPLFPPREPSPSLFPRRESSAPGGAAAANSPKPLFPPRESAGGLGVKGSSVKPSPFAGRQTSPEQNRPIAPQNLPSKPVFGAPVSAGPAVPGFSSLRQRDVHVSDTEFIQLRDFLYQQCGIFIAENRKYLVENRLSSRLRELGLRSFGEYYNYLRYDANRSVEMNKLFENMTTNETSFFRNGPQLDVFRDKVLIPLLNELRAKGQKKLRIWSAGCSSGEEPYTLAIILHEVLKQELPSWDIKITANDLSLAMLASARKGLYNDYAIRTTPPDMLAKHFIKEGNLYRIDPALQKLVNFGQINLSDKVQLSKVERSHIVFCRNVIIYFDDEMKRSVINSFYDNLLPGGYLLIGHSESLHNISRAFKPDHYAGAIVYRKQV